MTNRVDSNKRRFEPYPEYRDSGIEWLGEIPAHWEGTSVKRVAQRIQTGSTPPTSQEEYYADGTVPWYGPSSFSSELGLSVPPKLINESAIQDGAARLFAAGSTMIVTIGATIGKVGYLVEDGSSNQQITAVTPRPSIVNDRFLAYQIKQLEPVLQGIAPNTTLPILNQQEVGYLPVVLPPLGEQTKIVDFIEKNSGPIEALVVKVRDAIDRLNELRSALISAAVTGKIDVRGEV